MLSADAIFCVKEREMENCASCFGKLFPQNSEPCTKCREPSFRPASLQAVPCDYIAWAKLLPLLSPICTPRSASLAFKAKTGY